MNFKFPLFKRNVVDLEFTGFTFEMAEKIFKETFSKMDKK